MELDETDDDPDEEEGPDEQGKDPLSPPE